MSSANVIPTRGFTLNQAFAIVVLGVKLEDFDDDDEYKIEIKDDK